MADTVQQSPVASAARDNILAKFAKLMVDFAERQFPTPTFSC